MSENLERVHDIIQTMQGQIDKEILQVVDNMSSDINSRQNTIDELYQRMDTMRTELKRRGSDEMKERVLKLLSNDTLFSQIDSYIPNFIERKVYDQIIRALIPQINSLK